MYIQQGDVLIKRVERIPKGAKAKKGKTLAEGEHTGHSHVAEAEVELFEKDGVLYMSAPNGTTVRHEEHKPVNVPAGVYEIGIVQEYDHFKEEARNVAD